MTGLAGLFLFGVAAAERPGAPLVRGLGTGRRTDVRAVAALGVAAVIWGWAVAQYPVLLPGTTITLDNAGGPARHARRAGGAVRRRRRARRAVLRAAVQPQGPPPAALARASTERQPGRSVNSFTKSPTAPELPTIGSGGAKRCTRVGA